MKMFSRSFLKYVCYPSNYSCLSNARFCNKISPKVFSKYVLNEHSKTMPRIAFNNFRSINAKPEGKSKAPIILVLSITGGTILAYLTYKRNIRDVVDDENEQFVNHSLKEDLTLLDKFGPIPYLLIGGGCASFSACSAIRSNDPTAKVLIVSEENYLPYMRPPLSKNMWFNDKSEFSDNLLFTDWNGKKRSIFFEEPKFYKTIKDLLQDTDGGVSIIRGKKVSKVDPTNQIAYLDDGGKISYNKCLVATGSKPKNLSVFEDSDNSVKEHLMLFRTIKDFRKLEKISKTAKSIVIVGGGFLGSELACGLVKKGLKVFQIFPESGNIGKALPEYLSIWTSNVLTTEGVKIIPNVTVKEVNTQSNKVILKLSNDEILRADHIVVAVGADPQTDIGKASGLEIDLKNGGFVVNTEMEARKNLWVAGDVSCFYDINLGRRRVEHHDHAIVSGQLAGENMVGKTKRYWHQSMFWSDLGPNLSFEAIGLIDASLSTVGIFTEQNELDKSKSNGSQGLELQSFKTVNELRAPNSSDNYNKGILFYLRDYIIVGIMLWNTLGKIDLARKILNEKKTSDDIINIVKDFDLKSQ